MDKRRAGWMAAQAARIDQWPRLLRIVVSLLFALVLTVVIFLGLGLALNSVDNITSVMWGAVICGMVLYLIGWWALVGFNSDVHAEWHAGPPAVWAVVLTLVGAVVLVVLLAVLGFSLL